MVSDRDIFDFDLRGYVVLKGAIDQAHLAELNGIIDTIHPLEAGQWHGRVHGHQYGDSTSGINLQQIYEAGEAFERLINHAAWLEQVKHFVGGEGTFDHKHGPLFMDENFVTVRGPGEAIGLHSGGYTPTKRTQFHVKDGKFMCGQINVLMALTEMGPGDGTTMVIPGSHKSNFQPPDYAENEMQPGASVDSVENAIEVFMEPGDALLFTDAICHGSAKRTNEGQRRVCVYRYGPSWGYFRHGYRPSDELLARLTDERRRMVSPHDSPILPPE